MTDLNQTYDAIIVGGGIAGLTACAYLSKSGYHPLLIEQQESIGGLINSFSYKGFIFDGGIRSIESSGVLKPMIRDLGLDVDLKRSFVTLGIENKVIALSNRDDIEQYQQLMISIFPENESEIKEIVKSIHRILNDMDILYGIDNPMIIDLKSNPSYVLKTLIPWLFKFFPTLRRIDQLTLPVETYLKKYTKNQKLIDMIAQHFFKDTPAFFALGYFSIYFDYHYPKGGTEKLPKALESYIIDHGGKILNHTQITHVDVESKTIKDATGHSYTYKELIWASDLNHLYRSMDIAKISKPKLKQRVLSKKMSLVGKKGAESVLTVYATIDLDSNYFKKISSEHFFYTPKTDGLNHMELPLVDDMEKFTPFLSLFYDLNTYEISIPVLRDETLAPKGKTGLIISILIDYAVVSHVLKKGYYEPFKSFTEQYFIHVLSNSIYPDLKAYVIDTFCSTPLTFEKRTGNTDGAIFGFSYRNQNMPVEHKMSKITKSIQTHIPNIYQAGQWSFSPAGVPISIITGKLAADRVIKHLKKKT
jgi:phytoene dehydrogenase-like protein